MRFAPPGSETAISPRPSPGMSTSCSMTSTPVLNTPLSGLACLIVSLVVFLDDASESAPLTVGNLDCEN